MTKITPSVELHQKAVARQLLSAAKSKAVKF